MWRSQAYNLFVQTLNIVNAAIVSHKDRKPYRQLLTAYDTMFGARNIVVAIDTTDPETPEDHVTIRLKRSQFVIVAHSHCDQDVDWRVREEYLRQVNANPQYYVEHPTALSWDWIKARVGTRRSRSRTSKDD